MNGTRDSMKPGRQRHEPSAGQFVVVDENRIAYTAVMQLAQPAGARKPPLTFVSGPSGVGKTLLAKRLLRQCLATHSELAYAHLTAGEFADRLQLAAEKQTISDFQNRYRQLDLFICEDLQALENRRETQQQVLAALNELSLRGSRILLTSNQMPAQIGHLDPRIVNRCHGGVCVNISAPGPASRATLLAYFSQARQIPLTRDVIQFLAERLAVSPRELLGTLLQLETAALATNSALTVTFAERFLDDGVESPELSISLVSNAVARHFGVSVQDIRSAKRFRHLVLARQCAMFLCRTLTNASHSQIGRYFGRRSHSTVIHSCQRLQHDLSQHAELRLHLAEIRSSLGVRGAESAVPDTTQPQSKTR